MLYEFDPRDYLDDNKWVWLAVAGAVLVFDQLTKWLVMATMGLYESAELLPFLNLTLLHNTGAAFSLLSEGGGWQRWFFILLALAVSAALFLWIGQAYYWQTGLLLSLSLILGGALGNAIDRIVHGYVVDFIDLHAAGWHWPAFNVADSAISIGVVLFVWQALFGADRED